MLADIRKARVKRVLVVLACFAVVIMLLVVGHAVTPANAPQAPTPEALPTLRQQLEEQERIKERYKKDFYKPVTVIRT